MPDPSKAAMQQTAIIAALRSCQLFAASPLEDLRAAACISDIIRLERGAYLFREGEPSRGFYVVQRGAVNVHRVSPAGKEQVIHIFRVGESFAEATLATQSGYPADARAVEHSAVVLVRKEGFIHLLRTRPELALRMLASMSMHLRVLVARVEDLTLKDVETRLANWLLKRCPDARATGPGIIRLQSTKRVLAAELGTVSETLSRTLARFREHGLIAVAGANVTVLNPARLAAVLRGHLGE